jgi:hypothetical protein
MNLQIVLMAHEQTGEVADQNMDMNSLSQTAISGMDSSMSSLHHRIKSKTARKRYKKAFQALGASSSNISKFNTAVQKMVSDHAVLDGTYAGFFMNPEKYCQDNAMSNVQQCVQTVKGQLDEEYRNIYDGFQGGIESNETDIIVLRNAIKSAINLSQDNYHYLDYVGVYHNHNNEEQYWPIPKTIAYTWVFNTIANGGSLTYTRDTLATPDMMDCWQCQENENPDQNGCCSSEYVRRNHDWAINDTMKNLFMIEEDLEIIQAHEWQLYNDAGPGGQVSNEARRNAKATMKQRIDDRLDAIGGSVSSDQKKALIKLMMHPDM